MESFIKGITSSLHITEQRINLYIAKKDKFYKKVFIPKRKGGFREIYVPNPEIKLIQNYIKEIYLSKIAISDYAYAYKEGSSIINNVEPHIGNKHFLFIDIKNFFDNISKDIIKKIILANLNINESDATRIISLMTYKDMFVQGAVTSPSISNIYLKDFDTQVSVLVKKLNNGVYTRYSDDITISSKDYIDNKIVNEIKDLLNSFNLTINYSKTYFSSYVETIEITGLKINQNKTTINRNKKRMLNNMIYHKLKKKDSSKETVKQILGYLYFLMFVDPDYFNFINKKYKKDRNDLIKRLKEII